MKTTHTVIGPAEAHKLPQINAEVLYYFKKQVQLHIRGSVHYRTIHKEKIQQDATICQNLYYSIFT
jgi:hypothetical protein